MKFREQRAMRAGDWKYVSIEGNEFLFNLAKDARERANFARREPEKFVQLKADYEAWHATMPPIPPDAHATVPYGKADMAQPS
jgi:hypothetical protein